jgi:SAM-dependent methyltransferase
MIQETHASCESCDRVFLQVEGIWRFLLPERAGEYNQFLNQYHLLRSAEGWGALDNNYYRALPRVAANDPQRAIWRIRAKNFKRLRTLLENLRATTILDIGAGNGWLASRLTGLGYTVAALDLSDDPHDGLGAHTHFESRFDCYQAEFDRLPFAASQFDLVVFNASFHYSSGLAETLTEAKRVLRRDGGIILLDTPFYRELAEGEAMRAEWEKGFRARFGFMPMRAPGFLTPPQLGRAAADAGLDAAVWYADEDWLKRARRAWTRHQIGRATPRFPIVVLHRTNREVKSA